jgi:hypothetical protein
VVAQQATRSSGRLNSLGLRIARGCSVARFSFDLHVVTPQPLSAASVSENREQEFLGLIAGAERLVSFTANSTLGREDRWFSLWKGARLWIVLSRQATQVDLYFDPNFQ